MNRINRHNYEIFFIDYIDGKLSGEQLLDLQYFLQANPDLAQELEDIEDVTLQPDNVRYEDKSSLKKLVGELLVNASNFEEYCIAYIEKNLTKEKESQLEQYLELHPEKKTDYILFTNTVLSPNREVIYPNKSKLKKTITLHRVIRIATAVAASIAIIWFAALYITGLPDASSTYSANETSDSVSKMRETAGKHLQSIVQTGDTAAAIAFENKAVHTGSIKNKTVHAKETITHKKQNEIADYDVVSVQENKQSDVKQKDTIQAMDTGAMQNQVAIEGNNHNDLPIRQDTSLMAIDSLLTFPNSQDMQVYDYAVADTSFVTIKELIGKRIESKIQLDEKWRLQQNKSKFWQLAELLISTIRERTGRNIRLNNIYDERGNIEILAFEGERIEFSKKIK